MASFSWAVFAEKLSILGWRQKDYAERSGVALSTVSAWRMRNRVPVLAMVLIDEWVLRAERGRSDAADLAPRANKPRGRPFGQGGRHELWEPSGADLAKAPGADYRKRFEAWEEADMDQDGDEWGRG